MANLGIFSLRLAFFIVAFALLADFLGAARRDKGLMASGRNALIALFLCLSVALAVLTAALVTGDFTLKYVSEHSSQNLPLIYRVSALWAGAAGSLLLWLWAQAGLTIWAFSRPKAGAEVFAAQARGFSHLVSLFFLVILLFDKIPFAVTNLPLAGEGLNPLLQHPVMILHPPALFLGYAFFVLPFAWTMSRLLSGKTEAWAYQPQLSRWILLGWLFLSLGNILGSWWAYEELGWGGFWAWDPVENASLMPWLTATALLHAGKRYRPGASLGRWTLLLGLLTYSLCLFGTFLTRYGLVSSVHAFPEPGWGILFVIMIAMFWLGAGILAIRARGKTVPEARVAHASEFAFAWTNWLMVLLMLLILLATLFPFLSGVFHGRQISLKPETFTRLTAPGGIILLLLLGICPVLVRRGRFWSGQSIGAVLSALIAVVAGGATHLWVWATLPAAAYALLMILVNFIRPDATFKYRRTAWLGSRIAHLGVVLMFIGIASAEGFGQEQNLSLRPGESADFGSRSQYKVTFEELTSSAGSNYQLESAVLSVSKNGQFMCTLRPGQAQYDSGQITTEIDLYRSLRGDLYTAVTAIEGRVINLHILLKPGINWLWIGSLVMVAGTVLVFGAPRGKKDKA